MQIFLFCLHFVPFAGEKRQKKEHPVIFLTDALFGGIGQNGKYFDIF